MTLARNAGMKLFVELSRARLLRAFAAVERRKALEAAEAAGWPLPAELALHLRSRGWNPHA